MEEESSNTDALILETKPTDPRGLFYVESRGDGFGTSSGHWHKVRTAKARLLLRVRQI